MIITVDQLLERVMSKIDDDGVDPDDVLMVFNQCAHDIATVLDIRQLATVTDITFLAGDSVVELPTDYCKKLTKAYNKTTQLPVKVFSSRRTLDQSYGLKESSGNIIGITEEYPNVYCKDTPVSNQVIQIYYHRLPDDLESGGNFPRWIPMNFVHKLFFHFTIANASDLIEEGVEAEKVETLFHEDKYKAALEEFKLFIGPDPDYPYTVDKEFDFECID